MSQSESNIVEQLGALAPPELDPRTSERIRRRAKATFERHSRDDNKLLTWLSRGYDRTEPVLVGAISAVYLVWAFNTVIDLLS